MAHGFDFLKHLQKILPEVDQGVYESLLPVFPFAHPNTPVRCSEVNVSTTRNTSMKSFTLAYEDCTNGCDKHVERLKKVVSECCAQVPDKENGQLKLSFRMPIYDKVGGLHYSNITEFVNDIISCAVRIGSPNTYMLEEDSKVLDIFDRLGAARKGEKMKKDTLRIGFNSFSDLRHDGLTLLDADTLRLSKLLIQRRPKNLMCIIIPTAPGQMDNLEKNIACGLLVSPCRDRVFKIEELLDRCTDNQSLRSRLTMSGLGILTKDADRNIFCCSKPGTINFVMHKEKRVKYCFQLNGIDISLTCSEGKNYSFEPPMTTTVVHQKFGRIPEIKFRLSMNGDKPTEDFLNVVIQVILSLKSDVQKQCLRLKTYDIVTPSRRRHFGIMSCQSSVMSDLKRVRDGTTLNDMLNLPEEAVVSPFALRSRVRATLKKIDEIATQEQDLEDILKSLKEKLVTAARQNNLDV